MPRRDDDDDDSGDFDFSPQQKRKRRPPDRGERRSAGGGVAGVIRVLSLCVWLLLVLVTVGGGLLFAVALSKCDNVMQEASLGATFATAFIAAYLITRGLDEAGRKIIAMSGGPTPDDD